MSDYLPPESKATKTAKKKTASASSDATSSGSQRQDGIPLWLQVGVPEVALAPLMPVVASLYSRVHGSVGPQEKQAADDIVSRVLPEVAYCAGFLMKCADSGMTVQQTQRCILHDAMTNPIGGECWDAYLRLLAD